MPRRPRTRITTSNMNEQIDTGLKRVLDTLELLEMVLACLSMKDLLFAQRVCKKWKQIIERSPKLQEALFFRPSSVTTAFPFSPRHATAPLINRLSGLKPPTESETSVSLTRKDFRRNPLLQVKFSPFFSKPTNELALAGSKDLLVGSWRNPRRTRAAFSHADASWRKMLVVQPASAIVCEIFYLVQTHGGDHLSIADTTIDPLIEGLRMGWIYDLCYDIAVDSHGCFILRWDMLKSQDLWAPKLSILLRRTIGCMRPSRKWTELEALKALKSDSYSRPMVEYRTHQSEEEANRVNESATGLRGSYRVPPHLVIDEEDVKKAFNFI